MRLHLTSRSAASDGATPTRPITSDSINAATRDWLEAGLGYLPLLIWFVAGVTDTPRLAMAAYIVVAGMLVIRPSLGYLALLPMLTFYHSQGFAPHGPIFVLSGVALGSVIVRSAVGMARIPRYVRPALWCSLAFLALTAFQLFLGVRELGGEIPIRALGQFDQVFIILSVFAVGLVVLPGRSLTPYLVAFAFSFAVVAAFATVYFVEPNLVQLIGLAWMVPPDAYEYRASGVIANPNSLGLALACGLSWIIVSAVWQIARRRIVPAALLLPIISVAGHSLVLTFSRAAIVAVGVGLITALARRSLLAAGVLGATAVLAAVLIYPLFIEVRLGQTFGDASPAGEAAIVESDRLRSLMAVSAVRAFLDAPLVGHGFATFNEISPKYSDQSILTSAHDLYLKVAAEQGLLGLSLLGALFVSIVAPMWRAGNGPWTASLAVAAAFAVFSFTVDSLGNAQAVSTAFFLMAAGVAQAGFTRRQTLAAQRRSSNATHPPPNSLRRGWADVLRRG